MLLPFYFPSTVVPVPWVYLIDFGIAVLFVGFIKWQRDDFSVTAGWEPTLAYVLVFAVLYPGSAVLVGLNEGFVAAVGFYFRSLPRAFPNYVLFAVAANLLTSAMWPNQRLQRAALGSSSMEPSDGTGRRR